MSNSILIDQLDEEIQELENEPEQPKPEVVDESPPELPEKFRNKTASDIVEMYTNLEKEKSRLGNEVSELRNLTDMALKLKVAPPEPDALEPDDTPINSQDLWDNPDEVIRRRISSLPEVRKTSELEGKLATIERELKQSRFEAQHPDFQDVLQNPEFADWVRSNPYRTKQLQSANNYDLDAADDLFSTFKAITARKAEAPPSGQESETPAQGGAESKRRAALNKASLESGTTGNVGEKILRRRDLLKMRIEDPDAYYDDAFQQVLVKAYQEGRVK